MTPDWPTFMEERCPKCNAHLLTNGDYVWCSFVGTTNYPGCDYGITEKIPVDAAPDPQ